MVLQSPNMIPQSSGLLPTPPHQINHQKSDPFVGRSYYPLPFPLVTILEGSKLSDLISWDISVTSKHLKLKLEWSTSTKDPDVLSISLPLPIHILSAIKLYNLCQPSWTTSAVKNKLSVKIEWQISSSDLNLSSSQSTNANSIYSSNKSSNFYTPASRNMENLSDSGFGSLNSNSNSNGIHGNSDNWRRSVNLPGKPSFDSPRLSNRQHDIYIAPKSKDNKKSNTSSKNPSINLSSTKKSLSPVIAREVNLVNMKPEPSLTQGKTPSRRNEKNENNPVSSRDLKPLVPSTLSSNMKQTSSSCKNPEKSTKSKSKKNKNNTNSTELINSGSNVPTNISHSSIKPVLPSENSKSDVKLHESAHNDEILDCGLDSYHRKPAPSSIPINNDGFTHSSFEMDDYNVIGRCRLCKKKVSSPLVDLHLTRCPKLPDRDEMMSSFYEEITKIFRLDQATVEKSMINCFKTLLTESDIPNDHFKNTDTFNSFFSELDNLVDLLSEKVFVTLKITGIDKYDTLDYTKDNKSHLV